mmetsp:Transcript_71749/g.214233  ORF Transcript_71749/g.214233 Transcript_71749/m.214233 type:complete len:291 (-) Transcript_71749:106-978(-)
MAVRGKGLAALDLLTDLRAAIAQEAPRATGHLLRVRDALRPLDHLDLGVPDLSKERGVARAHDTPLGGPVDNLSRAHVHRVHRAARHGHAHQHGRGADPRAHGGAARGLLQGLVAGPLQEAAESLARHPEPQLLARGGLSGDRVPPVGHAEDAEAVGAGVAPQLAGGRELESVLGADARLGLRRDVPPPRRVVRMAEPGFLDLEPALARLDRQPPRQLRAGQRRLAVLRVLRHAQHRLRLPRRLGGLAASGEGGDRGLARGALHRALRGLCHGARLLGCIGKLLAQRDEP